MQKIHDTTAPTSRKRIVRPELLVRVPLEGSPRLALAVEQYGDELRLRHWLARASLPSLDGMVERWAEGDEDPVARRLRLTWHDPIAPVAIIAMPWGGPISAFLRGCRNEPEADAFRAWLASGPGTRELYRLAQTLTDSRESA